MQEKCKRNTNEIQMKYKWNRSEIEERNRKSSTRVALDTGKNTGKNTFKYQQLLKW